MNFIIFEVQSLSFFLNILTLFHVQKNENEALDATEEQVMDVNEIPQAANIKNNLKNISEIKHSEFLSDDTGKYEL